MLCGEGGWSQTVCEAAGAEPARVCFFGKTAEDTDAYEKLPLKAGPWRATEIGNPAEFQDSTAAIDVIQRRPAGSCGGKGRRVRPRLSEELNR